MSDNSKSTTFQTINGELLRHLEDEQLVCKTDTNPTCKLDVFCYTNYNTVLDSENTNPEKFNQLMQTRGVIVDSETGCVVVKAFPFSSEHVSQPPLEVMNDLADYRVFDSHEGTMIRVFYHADTWHISTNRKLNAFMSKWSSRISYGLMFKYALEYEVLVNPEFEKMLDLGAGDNIIDKFKKCLDISKQYMFLVRNSKENRIVCSAPDNFTVYHVGTYINGEISMDDDIKIRKPKEYKFDSPNELADHVNNVNYDQLQGLVMVGPIGDSEKQLRCFKVYNPDYAYYYKIRGSTTSLRYRYLQLRNTPDADALVYINKDSIPMFDECEKIIADHGETMFAMYREKYMFRNKEITFKPADYDLIKKVHTWYIQNKDDGRRNRNVTIHVVREFINNSTCSYLNKMIKDTQYASRKQKKSSEIQELTEEQ
jgi:hypothetical protein